MDVREELKPPIWEEEGYDNEELYELKQVKLVDSLLRESKEKYLEPKRRWSEIADRFERETERLSGYGWNTKNPARTNMPLLQKAVLEGVALRTEALPRPQYTSRQSDQDVFASALNYFASEELDSNSFDKLVMLACKDASLFNLGILKQTIDQDAKGLFNGDGKIRFEKIEPRYFWPDPFHSSCDWDGSKYWIFAVPQDLSDIRKWFPLKGPLVEPEPRYSMSQETDDGETESSRHILSPAMTDDTHIVGERHRALLKECWLKDNRKEFVPALDENGETIYDEQGDAIGELVPKYPNGRLLISANGVLLLDIANPFRHGVPPYSFLQSRPSDKLITYGDAELIALMEDKLNELHRRTMRNAIANLASPWLVDNGAFDSPQKYHNLTDEPELVIIARPQSRVQRLPPGEIPGFIFPLVQNIQQTLDDVLGIQGVMRGQLTEGAQLSAEAIQSLQGSSSSRIRMQARLTEDFLKHTGQLLQWNIRQCYPSELKINIKDPSSGEPKQLLWNAEKAQDDYPVQIQAGSSMPGAKLSASQQALVLFKEGVVDRQYVLDVSQIPGSGGILKRIQDREDKLASLGFQYDMKRKNKGGSAGRRTQSPAI